MAAAAAAGAAAGTSAASSLAPAAMSAGAGLVGSLLGYASSQQNLDYVKAYNEKMLEREDNYMQRRVQDFTSAGFSPLAALDGAGNYTSMVTAPQIDASQFTSPLVNGFSQAGQQLVGVNSSQLNYKASVYATEAKKSFDRMYENLERDKLSLEQNKYIDELENAKSIAESAQANERNIAKYHDDMMDKIARLNREHSDLNFNEDQKQKMKMLETQLDHAWKMAEKERNQKERQFWFGQIFETMRSMLQVVAPIASVAAMGAM